MNSCRAMRCGPSGGRVWNSTAYQGCRLIISRVRLARTRRSARQSGPGRSGTAISVATRSSIRSTRPSLLYTYRYSAIGVYGPSRAATAFMVSASGPASSATATAAVTISSRPRDRCRGGGDGWVQISPARSVSRLRTREVYHINTNIYNKLSEEASSLKAIALGAEVGPGTEVGQGAEVGPGAVGVGLARDFGAGGARGGGGGA